MLSCFLETCLNEPINQKNAVGTKSTDLEAECEQLAAARRSRREDKKDDTRSYKSENSREDQRETNRETRKPYANLFVDSGFAD